MLRDLQHSFRFLGRNAGGLRDLVDRRFLVLDSFFDGLGMGTGFALLLMAIGLFRELVGRGSLFAEFDKLIGGEPLAGLVIVDGGWLLAVLPPGAFFSLALAVALKNHLDGRRKMARQS